MRLSGFAAVLVTMGVLAVASPVAEPGKPGNRPTSGTPVPTPSTTTTSAAAQPSAGPPQGEPIIENYNGTATQGNKTLMSLNKSWKENRAEPIIEHYNGTATQGNKTYMSLNKSWKRSDGKAEWAQDFDVLCGPQFGMAADGPFWEGYTYLSQIKGAMHMEPGPRKCSRVSCSWDTAVKACNDNAEDVYLESWQPITAAMMAVYNRCRQDGHSYFSGQAFHKTQAWNVIVGNDPC